MKVFEFRGKTISNWTDYDQADSDIKAMPVSDSEKLMLSKALEASSRIANGLPPEPLPDEEQKQLNRDLEEKHAKQQLISQPDESDLRHMNAERYQQTIEALAAS